MPFTWSEKYYIGIGEIDKQHMGLLELLNNTYDKYATSSNIKLTEKSKMNVYLDILKLREYAFVHFITEEKYMIKYHYPKFFSHKAEHDKFIKSIFQLEDDLFNSEKILAKDLINFIFEWYDKHVTKVDKEFGNYLRDSRILDNIIYSKK
jgi:hemerythrin